MAQGSPLASIPWNRLYQLLTAAGRCQRLFALGDPRHFPRLATGTPHWHKCFNAKLHPSDPSEERMPLSTSIALPRQWLLDVDYWREIATSPDAFRIASCTPAGRLGRHPCQCLWEIDLFVSTGGDRYFPRIAPFDRLSS